MRRYVILAALAVSSLAGAYALNQYEKQQKEKTRKAQENTKDNRKKAWTKIMTDTVDRVLGRKDKDDDFRN